MANCLDRNTGAQQQMQFIYPNNVKKLFLPKDLNGKLNPVTFEVAHTGSHSTIYWHLDDQFLGSTKDDHKFTLVLPSGYHEMTCVDEKGNSISTRFEAILSN